MIEKNTEKKRIVLVIGILLMGIFAISAVSAYKNLCLTYGQSLPNGYTCFHDQCINICVTDNNFPTNPGFCDDLGSCIFLEGGAEVDGEAPVLTVNSPLEGFIYNSRSVLFDLEFSEPSSIYYKDNNDDGSWKRICSNCEDSYSKGIIFPDGENNVSIRATDRNGNSAEATKTFSVDSQDPRILRTSPKSGFANGTFTVEFDEANPKQLVLNYGNLGTGYQQKSLDLNLECFEDGSTTACSTNVNLAPYDNQDIEYWFELTDIADSMDSSSVIMLKVDNTNPVIHALEYRNEKGITHIIVNFTEINLEVITYIDLDDPRGREGNLCKKVDSVCDGKLRLEDGDHEIVVKIYDLAGNMAEDTISFFSDSKDPKIKKVEPKRGFANGDFYIEFDEENPVELLLKYGTFSDMRTHNVFLGTCVLGKKNYECDVLGINLNDFDGEKIEYYFELTDRVGNKDTSKTNDLEVDTTFPVLNNPGSFWMQGNASEGDDKYIFFNFSITEKNFDEVLYIDYSDSMPRWKRLCSNLDKENKEDIAGICERKKSFKKEEYHSVDIQIVDEAGNAISTERLEFFVEA